MKTFLQKFLLFSLPIYSLFWFFTSCSPGKYELKRREIENQYGASSTIVFKQMCIDIKADSCTCELIESFIPLAHTLEQQFRFEAVEQKVNEMGLAQSIEAIRTSIQNSLTMAANVYLERIKITSLIWQKQTQIISRIQQNECHAIDETSILALLDNHFAQIGYYDFQAKITEISLLGFSKLAELNADKDETALSLKKGFAYMDILSSTAAKPAGSKEHYLVNAEKIYLQFQNALKELQNFKEKTE